jgi:hypothetical protein
VSLAQMPPVVNGYSDLPFWHLLVFIWKIHFSSTTNWSSPFSISHLLPYFWCCVLGFNSIFASANRSCTIVQGLLRLLFILHLFGILMLEKLYVIQELHRFSFIRNPLGSVLFAKLCFNLALSKQTTTNSYFLGNSAGYYSCEKVFKLTVHAIKFEF